MNIRSDTLKALRARRSLSQDDLARATVGPEQVSVSTIKRIEGANGDYDANPRIAKKLAEVLKVEPATLAKEWQEPTDPEPRLREIGYRPHKAIIDDKTALAFQVVEQVYGIPIQSQILMAPLFSALLAEGSFAWRREKLAEVNETTDRLLSLAEGHLSFALGAARVSDGAFEEEQSIAKRDLFGREVEENALDYGYDPVGKNNPFADFLWDFGHKYDSADIVIDDGWGGWKTPEGMPEYEVAGDYLEEITGGDTWAEYALVRGHARIREIPKELMGKEATPARIAWLTSKVPAEDRTRQDTPLEELLQEL